MNTTPVDVENPPEWAIIEALLRCGIDPSQRNFTDWRDRTYAKAVRLLAGMIATHEQRPVDPLLMEAREICAETVRTSEATWKRSNADRYIAGGYDEDDGLRAVLAALKRGIELGASK